MKPEVEGYGVRPRTPPINLSLEDGKDGLVEKGRKHSLGEEGAGRLLIAAAAKTSSPFRHHC